MMIERFKAIAAALSEITKRDVTEWTVRAWARRAVDPLPVTYFAGRPGIDAGALAAWAKRQEGQRRPQSTEPA